MTRRLISPLLVAVLLLVVAPASAPAALPAGFQETTLVSGLTKPTAVAWAPDGRMFVTQVNGVVRVVSPTGVLRTAPLLDIRNHVNSQTDKGLLGIAVDKDFAQNGFLYLLYSYENDPTTPTGPKTSRLTRVTVAPDNTVSPETVLLGKIGTPPCPAPANDVDCVAGPFHVIGTVRSDPADGTLWVGFGDHQGGPGLGFLPLNEQSLGGKILHVDRNGNGLEPHPFCPTNHNLTHVCTKVFAKGLRNPFRFTLRPGTGPFVADVGGNTYEELNMTIPGGHYGWPCYEGLIRTPSYDTRPECAAEYAKTGPAAAIPPAWPCLHETCQTIIAGPKYEGTSYPAEFRGEFFFGDYVNGFIKRFEPVGNQVTNVQNFATGIFSFVDLEAAPNGNLVYVSFGRGTSGTGFVREIRFSAGNSPPVARASANPTSGPTPLTVQFRGSDSTDANGDPLTYDWDFGDGSAHSTAANPTHTYTGPAQQRTARLTVSDGRGGTDSATVSLSPGNTPPNASITAPATMRGGQTIQLQGSATDNEDGSVPAARFEWTISLIHKDHLHSYGSPSGTTTTSFLAGTDHDADSHYEVTLKVTDSLGLEDSETVRILPETRQFTINSEPSGAPISFGGSNFTTPFSKQSAVGFRTQVSAAAQFVSGGQTYEFESWSDGGAQLHEVAVPPQDTTLVARYRLRPGGTSSYRDAVLGSAGLSSYWRLGEASGTTATDSKGGRHGTYRSGTTLGAPGALTGDSDTAASFNGSSGFVSVPQINLAGDFTLEAWARPTGKINNADSIFGKAALGNDTNFWAGRYRLWTGGQDIVVANSVAVPDRWGHYVVTRSGSTVRLYVNGVLESTGTWTGTFSLSAIGAGGISTGLKFAGRIDEPAVYTQALTAETIQQHYGIGVQTIQTTYRDVVLGSGGLSSYWRLGEASGTTATDSKGGRHGTYRPGVTLGAPGALGGDSDTAASFDGATGHVSVPQLDLAGDFTLEAWARPTGTINNADAIFGKAAHANDTNFWAGRYRLFTGGRDIVVASSVAVPDRWGHYVVTRSGSTVRLYVNGVLESTGTWTGTFSLEAIGAGAASTGLKFAGSIDEPAVYTQALSAEAIQQHYAVGSASGSLFAAPSTLVESWPRAPTH